MDNFTLAVLAGDAAVVISLIVLMVFFDKGSPAPLTAEPVKPSTMKPPSVKPSGKKSA